MPPVCYDFSGNRNRQWSQVMRITRKYAKAIAYFRTSSAANVGADKDSDKRQRAAIASFAQRERIEIVAEFYGAGLIQSRLGLVSQLS
jgi:hypothetical protein